ncbi:ATP-dependent zinc protease family protein [Marinobacter fonticola]|uniref:ATP-dependent zinc protease family protein n=1 Tax=Marinobacter fonticola TaxID=2603215 RepID=UPI0011E88ACA|nr:RimK/LysX family protein [Marinobacter fonticola]
MPMRAACTLPNILLLALTSLAIAGCAPGSALVEREDLSSLEQGQTSQSREIGKLSDDLKAHHRGVVRNSNENTRALIETIRQQITPPACPERPQLSCPEVREQTSSTSSQRLNGMLIVGELEQVHFMEPGFTYEARIDSGAETSSLDARNVTYFERNGEDWVRFDVPVPRTKSELRTLERPLSRNARIIQASADDSERRAVVELQFAIGDHVQKAEFTLSNREHLSHSVLVGRNILRDVMLVDVGKEHATSLPQKLEAKPQATKAGAGDNQ